MLLSTNKVVANVVMSISKIEVCLEDGAKSLKGEWYFMLSMNTISIPMALGFLLLLVSKVQHQMESGEDLLICGFLLELPPFL
jgi:hypothetical protein